MGRHTLFFLVLLVIGCGKDQQSEKEYSENIKPEESIGKVSADELLDIESEKNFDKESNNSIIEQNPNRIKWNIGIDSAAKLVRLGYSFWDLIESDNAIIFSLMDSLFSNKPETRIFYLPVFRNIMIQSDGYVSEAVSGYTLRYIEKYPSEFIQLIDTPCRR